MAYCRKESDFFSDIKKPFPNLTNEKSKSKVTYFFSKRLTANKFSIKSKCKYKIYKKVKITKSNIICNSKKINVYGNRVMNKLSH